jgi:hypothetical protein
VPERKHSEQNGSDAEKKGAPKKKADVKRILLIGIPLLILAIGMKVLDDEARILWVENNSTTSTAARFYLFTGEKERVLKANEEQTVELHWETELDMGTLSLEVDATGREAFTIGAEPRTLRMELQRGDKIHLTVHGRRAKGRFLIEWRKAP